MNVLPFSKFVENKAIMNVNMDLLITWGGVSKRYDKGDIIFYEGEQSRFYYQIIEGKVKMFNINDEGKLFIQGVFCTGNSFGEPPLFLNECYPCSAVAIESTIVIKLLKDTFLKLVFENKDILEGFTLEFAKRIFDKTNKSKNIATQNPEHRIISFLDRHKSNSCEGKERILIPYTRQEIADSMALRVETVIRTLKKLSEKKIIEIRNHKLYY